MTTASRHSTHSNRRRASRALGSLALFAVACASPGGTLSWTKPGATDADLKAAEVECKKKAFEVREPNKRYRSTAQASAFLRCMKEAGWEQVLVED